MKVIYTAKNYAGETKGGEIDVKDERDLAKQLRSEGYILTSFKELKEDADKRIKINWLERFSTVPLSEKMIFTRNLGVMVASGLSLSRAILNLTVQIRNKKMVAILKVVQSEIQSGSTLADALSKYPGVFNELFVNMIRVGESSGNLEEVLNILATQLEKEHELTSKVKGALIYPSVILIAMIGIGIIMMISVVPKITSVFKDLNATLPASTQFIISTSNFLQHYYLTLIISIIFLIIFIRLFATTKTGKKIFGFIAINTPFLKNIIVKINCARFARVYSSLLKSGISVVEALQILSRTLTNFYYKKSLQNASINIQKGINLSKLFYKETKIYPVLVPQMLEVGEETGKTEVVLSKLAEFYESEVERITKNLSSIIEPILMLLIGSAVGFFAISILQPMYSVLGSIK